VQACEDLVEAGGSRAPRHEPPLAVLPARTDGLEQAKVAGRRRLHQLGRAAVDELGTQLQRRGAGRIMLREDPAAEARARLQQRHRHSRLGQYSRRRQAGHPTAEHQHIELRHGRDSTRAWLLQIGRCGMQR